MVASLKGLQQNPALAPAMAIPKAISGTLVDVETKSIPIVAAIAPQNMGVRGPATRSSQAESGKDRKKKKKENPAIKPASVDERPKFSRNIGRYRPNPKRAGPKAMAVVTKPLIAKEILRFIWFFRIFGLGLIVT